MKRRKIADVVLNHFRSNGLGLPMVNAGDFDGDGKDEVALLAQSKTKKPMIVVLSHSNKLKLIAKLPLDQLEEKNDKFISYLSGVKSVNINGKKRDLFQYENWLGATKAYYLEDGKLVENTTPIAN